MLAGARPSMNLLEIRHRRRLILPFPSAPPRPLEISLCRRRRSSPPRAVIAVPGVLLCQLRSGVDPEADPVGGRSRRGSRLARRLQLDSIGPRSTGSSSSTSGPSRSLPSVPCPCSDWGTNATPPPPATAFRFVAVLHLHSIGHLVVV
jgi:hypothetical protein